MPFAPVAITRPNWRSGSACSNRSTAGAGTGRCHPSGNPRWPPNRRPAARRWSCWSTSTSERGGRSRPKPPQPVQAAPGTRRIREGPRDGRRQGPRQGTGGLRTSPDDRHSQHTELGTHRHPLLWPFRLRRINARAGSAGAADGAHRNCQGDERPTGGEIADARDGMGPGVVVDDPAGEAARGNIGGTIGGVVESSFRRATVTLHAPYEDTITTSVVGTVGRQTAFGYGSTRSGGSMRTKLKRCAETSG